ncbi:ornithine cyclodeaminase family protein [Legionella shakespearei]|uniref:Ornithine cyclodeaminase n=1 Tax=Legionella shakespearei DSM 23087 TaxID=1122169 RepID=A0A0W0YQV0_9GAMM|nr:ornithine cyclodeaminase family protein [Legionella shakespearei]KTD58886.1 ornithine cyclodeaminase [Legionella shakespearei DSM 23087]
MLLLNQSDIKKIMPMTQAIAACKEALALYSRGEAIVPLRLNIDLPKQNAQSLFMPAYIPSLDTLGIKIVSVFPQNAVLGKATVPSQMILMDGKTGEVCALIDGTYLTQLRTGALQGAATDLLARKEAKTAVLFGTGGQAQTQLEALLSVRALEEIQVFGTNPIKTQQFVIQMQEEFTRFNTRILAGGDADKAIERADIITAITNSKKPVFDGLKVKNGTHINGMGAYTPEMQELSESIIQKANKIFFDTTEGVLAEAGDILIPLQSGSIDHSHFSGELGQVISGLIQGRENEQEITVFKSVGSAVLDLVTASMIYQTALVHQQGKKI